MSDWSSDVCSSDLPGRNGLLVFGREHCFDEVVVGIGFVDETLPKFVDCNQARLGAIQRELREEAFCAVGTIGDGDWRSEERRVGNECVRTSRYRWSTEH